MSFAGQLLLDFGAPAEGRFEDFWAAGNEQVVARLTQLAGKGGAAFLVLWGETGAGKSHLLHALCDAYGNKQRTAILVDGNQRNHLHPAMLEGLADVDLVCIDNIERFAGDPAWEEALFHLYNQIQLSGSAWVVSADVAPLQSALRLADLKSRLCACEVYRLQVLADSAKRDWLRQFAHVRGFDLELEWCDYILNRSARDPATLTQVINKLDAASLSAQRAVTLPFIKQVMGW